eukprot:1256848-Prymnesium_polylepis.1
MDVGVVRAELQYRAVRQSPRAPLAVPVDEPHHVRSVGRVRPITHPLDRVERVERAGSSQERADHLRSATPPTRKWQVCRPVTAFVRPGLAT